MRLQTVLFLKDTFKQSNIFVYILPRHVHRGFYEKFCRNQDAYNLMLLSSAFYRDFITVQWSDQGWINRQKNLFKNV